MRMQRISRYDRHARSGMPRLYLLLLALVLLLIYLLGELRPSARPPTLKWGDVVHPAPSSVR